MTEPIVISATPTLFAEDLSVDTAAIRAHLTWLRECGVDAIFAAGTTGEFTTLSDEERLEVLDVSLEVFGPDRTYFHVGAPSARQAIALARSARRRGAELLAAVTPYYHPAPEEVVLDYYQQIVTAADGAQVFAYLFEARTTTHSEPSVLHKLSARGVAGVKISGEPDERVSEFLRERPAGFTVYSGNDVSFEWFSTAGGDGIVSGVSSVYPEPFVRLREALRSADEDALRSAQRDVEQAVSAVRGGSLSHLKAGVTARGFTGGPVRSAVARAPENDCRRIAELVDAVVPA